MMTLEKSLADAARLAKWLIETKGVKRKTAYIISAKKYRLPTYDLVRREYQKIKIHQINLL